MSDKIAYEKHPVTPERKKELRSKGFKIIDAKFDPNPKKKVEGNKFDRKGAMEYLVEKEVQHAKNISNKDLEALVEKTKQEGDE